MRTERFCSSGSASTSAIWQISQNGGELMLLRMMVWCPRGAFPPSCNISMFVLRECFPNGSSALVGWPSSGSCTRVSEASKNDQQHDDAHEQRGRGQARQDECPAAARQGRKRTRVEDRADQAFLVHAPYGHQGAEHDLGGEAAAEGQAQADEGAAGRDQGPQAGRARRQAPGPRREGEATKGERAQVGVGPSGALLLLAMDACIAGFCCQIH